MGILYRLKKYFPKLLLTVLLLVISPYVINAIWILGNSAIHQLQWEREGSQNYEIRSKLVALSPFSGISLITVKNGNITNVVDEQTQFTGDKHLLQDYQDRTIDGMFNKIYACALNYPWLTCSFDYDSKLGYPKKITVDCSNPDICYESIEAINVNIFSK